MSNLILDHCGKFIGKFRLSYKHHISCMVAVQEVAQRNSNPQKVGYSVAKL